MDLNVPFFTPICTGCHKLNVSSFRLLYFIVKAILISRLILHIVKITSAIRVNSSALASKADGATPTAAAAEPIACAVGAIAVEFTKISSALIIAADSFDTFTDNFGCNFNSAMGNKLINMLNNIKKDIS